MTDIEFANQSTGWVTGTTSFLSRTDDGGRIWTTVSPFTASALNALSVTPLHVWVVGENGDVFRSEYTPNALEQGEATLPVTSSLSVFPNPFNSTTTLQFELPREMKVEIVLYDVLGREAMHLVEEVFQAGTHKLSIDANNLTSGVYFARLSSAEYSATSKLLLLR